MATRLPSIRWRFSRMGERWPSAVSARFACGMWPSKQERITLRLSPDASVSEQVNVEDLAVTPDGNALISRQSDGTVRIWHGESTSADQTMSPATQSNPDVEHMASGPQFFAQRAELPTLVSDTGTGHCLTFSRPNDRGLGGIASNQVDDPGATAQRRNF